MNSNVKQKDISVGGLVLRQTKLGSGGLKKEHLNQHKKGHLKFPINKGKE